MRKVLVINPILYTAEHNRIPQVCSIKDTMIYTMCRGFLEAGCEVTLIAAKDYHPIKEETYPFPVLWFGTVWHKLFQPRCFPYMPALRRFLREHKEYDMIVSSEVFASWSYTAARLYPDKTLVWHELAAHNHMLHQLPSKFWYRFVARLLMRRAKVVPRSAAAASFIGQFMPRVAQTCIDHGVDLAKFPLPDVRDKADQFVVVSQLIARKQIERTIEAFAGFVRQGNAGYRLCIIGQGEEEERLKGLVGKLRLEDQTVFYGQMSHAELMPIVARSKALLVSTRKDNNMVSIVESIALGTPVLTTSVPYNAAYIREQELGIVEDAWGADALARIVAHNERYVDNCVRYREQLSNVSCAERFFTLL